MTANRQNTWNIRNCMQSIAIIAIGTEMHLKRINFIETHSFRNSMLAPNLPSCLFVFSVLCVLAKLCPLWPTKLKRPPKLIAFFLELIFILYASELLVQQIWLPSLRLLNQLCYNLSKYVIELNICFFKHSSSELSHWLRYDAFYIGRFLLALGVFAIMLDVTGCLDNLYAQFICCQNPIQLNLPRNFDADEIPQCSKDDALNFEPYVRYRSVKRRKTPMRKLNDGTSHILKNDANVEEFSC